MRHIENPKSTSHQPTVTVMDPIYKGKKITYVNKWGIKKSLLTQVCLPITGKNCCHVLIMIAIIILKNTCWDNKQFNHHVYTTS
jgi:hypothetical protein